MPDQPTDPQPDDPTTTPDPQPPNLPDKEAPKEPSPLRNVVSFHGVRGQIIVAILLAALGFAAVVQVRLTRTDEDFSGQRREELIQLLDSLSAASDRAQTQIDDLENTRRELLSSSERRKAAVEESQRRLQVLQILAGTVPVVGPGITVTIDDPNGLVDEAALINAVGELREAGAEAIEINDSVRVVASTSFTTEDGVISADGVELRPPYVIDAIGSADTLSRALDFPGGLREQVEKVDGGHLEVEESNRVEVSSLHTVGPPEYSQPTDD